jgi:hypothetical protein
MSARRDEQVGRFDIAVNDASGMRGVKRVGDFDGDIEQRAQGHRSPVDAMLERLALEQLHDDEVLVLVLADVVDRADVRMIQSRGRLRLALKALDGHGIARQIGGEELQCHRSAKTRILGAVHDTHAAAAKVLDHLVVTDGPGDQVHDAGFYCSSGSVMTDLRTY